MFRRHLLISLSSVSIAAAAWAGTQSSAEDARAGRGDPTRPEQWMVTEYRSSVIAPTLSSVLIGGGRRLAVIDGRVMAEGEEIAGMRLRKVETDRVVLSTADGVPITVRLDGNQVIKEVR